MEVKSKILQLSFRQRLELRGHSALVKLAKEGFRVLSIGKIKVFKDPKEDEDSNARNPSVDDKDKTRNPRGGIKFKTQVEIQNNIKVIEAHRVGNNESHKIRE